MPYLCFRIVTGALIDGLPTALTPSGDVVVESRTCIDGANTFLYTRELCRLVLVLLTKLRLARGDALEISGA